MTSNAKMLSDKVMAQLNAGQFARAAKTAKTAHKKFPKEAHFANLAGMALAQSGHEREAAAFFHKAYRMNPKAENIQNNLVQALVMSDQHIKAQDLIGRLLAKRNDPSELLYLHAMSLMRSGDGDAALTMAQKATAANPEHAKAHNLCGMILSDQGRDGEAIDSYQASLLLAPNKPDTLSNLSLPLSRSNRGDEALTMLEQALAINPAHLNAQQRYAIQLNEAGRVAEAKQAFHALLQIAPNHAETLYQLSQMQTARENAALLPVVKSALSKAAKNAPDRVHLNFALANIYWRASDLEHAARALKAANDQAARARPFNAAYEVQQKAAILGLFASDTLPPVASNTGPTPIFVIGQPRSGTTLAEQILSAHPDVTGFGELATAGRLAAQALDAGQGFKPEKFAADYLADLPKMPDGARAFIDKMPVNYRYVGFLASAFPNARFICLGRDPRDVALSMWRSYFPSRGMDFTFDFAAMAHVANLHKEYMAHWAQMFPDRILDIKYEDIVGDVEAASRKLAQFCALDWDAAMARPDQNPSAVRTASVAQVRQGVHTRSVGGWARMKDQLDPFVQVLDKGLWPEVT